MPSRLLLALALSLILHASLLAPWAIKGGEPRPQPILQAMLRLPVKAAADDRQPLLKDTLAPEKSTAAANPPPVPPTPRTSSRAQPTARPTAPVIADRDVAVAQRKLSEHVFYPLEAVDRGIEGEVRLILTVADDGRIRDVQVGVSSGHTILDQAAQRAAWTMGRVNWAHTHSRELILPVVFRLE